MQYDTCDLETLSATCRMVKKITAALRRIYTTIRSASNEEKMVMLFFFLLFLTVFLGDGKHQTIDVYISGYVLFLGIYWCFLTKHRQQMMPKPILGLWCGIILYTLVLSLCSDSVAYSIYAVNRYIIGFFVFYFFQAIANKKVLVTCYYGVLFLSAAAAVSSLIVNLFPELGASLPDMNLLLPKYGHNYLAHLIIFLIPMATGNVIHRKKWQDYVILSGVIIVLIATFARGAWILIAGYSIYTILSRRTLLLRKQKLLFIGATTLLCMLFVGLFHFTGPQLTATGNTKQLVQQFLTKETPIQNRLEYWKQSVIAIRERPIAGSGPGTFFLQSQRLQKRPETYSLFAHSFPLQTMVESGLIGALGLFILLFLLFRHSLRNLQSLDTKTKYYAVPLVEGVVLTGLYSIYEFNLDFIIIWILFWAILSVSIGIRAKQTDGTRRTPLLVHAALLWLLLFYGLSLTGLVLQFLSKNTATVAVIPFHTPVAADYIQKQQQRGVLLSNHQIQMLSFFHKNDHQIIDAILKTNEATLSAADKRSMYTKLITLYPKNEQYYVQYIDFLIQEKSYQEAGIQIETYSLEFLPPMYRDAIRHVGPFQENEVKEIKAMTSDLANDAMNHEKRVSRFYYIAGFADITTSPERTKKLWEAAQQLDPDLSYYYVELASLTQTMLHDAEGARQILIDCRKSDAAKEHCIDVEQHGLPEVGSLKKNILVFP